MASIQIGQVQRALFGGSQIGADGSHEIRRAWAPPRRAARLSRGNSNSGGSFADLVGQRAGARDDGDGMNSLADARVVAHQVKRFERGGVGTNHQHVALLARLGAGERLAQPLQVGLLVGEVEIVDVGERGVGIAPRAIDLGGGTADRHNSLCPLRGRGRTLPRTV